MYCQNCEKEIPSGMKFCTGCGMKVEEACQPVAKQQTPATNTKKQSPIKKTGIKISLGCLGLFVLLIIIGSLPPVEKTEQPHKTEQAPVTVPVAKDLKINEKERKPVKGVVKVDPAVKKLTRELEVAEARLAEIEVYKRDMIIALKDSDIYASQFQEAVDAGDVYKSYELADKAWFANYEAITKKMSKIKVPAGLKEAHQEYNDGMTLQQVAYKKFRTMIDNDGKPKYMEDYMETVGFANSSITSAAGKIEAAMADAEKAVTRLKTELKREAGK